jgi:RNA polymerase sigma-70 factor (ECF subfamily)
VDIADAELAGLLAHSSHGSNAEGALERLEAYRKLHETISLLKPNYRIAITLFYFEERSLRDIAQILGTMQSTVRWRLFRARALLAKQLNQSRGDLR